MHEYIRKLITFGNIHSALEQTVQIEKEEFYLLEVFTTFWDEVGNEVIGCITLPMYGAFVTEEKCQLLGNLKNKKVLDLCCGSGKSMEYVSKKEPAQIWGIDISEQQIEKAKQYLDEKKIKAKLICAPMESECGMPKDFFDLIYSVYGIGWAVDLLETFRKIHSYLKADGKLSTYINTLVKVGFMIEEVIEESDKDILSDYKGDSYAKKASMLPVTFVIKARKI